MAFDKYNGIETHIPFMIPRKIKEPWIHCRTKNGSRFTCPLRTLEARLKATSDSIDEDDMVIHIYPS